MMDSIVVCSGGFDPIHSGHLAIINEAYRTHGKKVTILLNSDAWLIAKKGKPFMSAKERRTILENLSAVEEVIEFDDSEGNCCKALEALKVLRPGKKIIFCNGGDRNAQNIPEMTVSGIEFAFGIGGDFKMNSSSTILNEWQHRVQDRTWGNFRDLFKDNNVRVKELIVSPGSGISYQRHQKRSEFWVVSSGKCKIKYSDKEPDQFKIYDVSEGNSFYIPTTCWHQVYNETKEECHIIEVQYGKYSSEDDIERLEYYSK